MVHFRFSIPNLKYVPIFVENLYKKSVTMTPFTFQKPVNMTFPMPFEMPWVSAISLT
jgi:hypothetical protein